MNGSKNKRAWLAGLLNFFFPGAGYLYTGRRRALGLIFLLGAIGLTFVEQSLEPVDITLYWTMFATVFLMNTAFAVDGYQEARRTRLA